MPRWAQQNTKEFHQLLLPSGEVIDLHTASKKGKWVISSQGWGMPPVSWQTTQAPYQHGQTVRDYRLEPRTISLLTYQSFCTRDGLWSGRESLIDAIRPNQTEIAYDDYWILRTAEGTDEMIMSLCEWEGKLYGLTWTGHLLVWDDVGAWQIAAEPPTNGLVTLDHGYWLTTGTMSMKEIPPAYIGLLSVMNDFDDAQFLAQTFTTTNPFTCTAAKVYIVATGAPGDLTVSIKATDANGHPTGADLASGTADVTGFGPGWYTMTFGAPIDLAGQTKYALHCSLAGGGLPANCVSWASDWTGTFVGGNQEIWIGAGPWAAQDYDLWFELVASPVTYVEKNMLWAIGEEATLPASLVWAFDGEWAQNYWAINDADDKAYCGLIQDGELLIGTGNDGLARKYDRAHNDYVLDAIGDATDDDLISVAWYNGKLYFGTSVLGELWEWNGVLTLTEVAPQTTAQTQIFDLAVYQGKLYGVTGPDGYLVQWNDVNAWVVKTGAAGDDLFRSRVYQGRLYAGGGDGKLYRWNDNNAWETICTALSLGVWTEEVYSMCVFRNRLFAGSDDFRYLMEYIHDLEEHDQQPLVLRRHLSNGEKRDIEVWIGEGPQFDDTPGGWRENSFQELLRFVAYNPVMYDPDTLTVTWTMGVGFVSESQNIDYTGTWEEHPTITIGGPLHSLTVINETLGEYIKLDYDIPDAVTVTIDCEKLTIEDSAHNNLISALTPESSFATFRIDPPPVTPLAVGRNVIRVIGHGSDAGTTLHMDYKRRFIGI